MSQTDLAREAGMSKTAMNRLLNGGRNVSAGELAVIAHVLDVDVAELLGQKPAQASVKSRPLALAARLSAGESAIEAAVGRARELLELMDQLDRLVDASPAQLAAIPSRPNGWSYKHQGTQLAGRVRESLGLGDSCIEDITTLAAEEFGLAVAREPLPHAVIGLLVTDEPTGRDGSGAAGASLVLVNSADTYGRQRFTVAHELGHLLFGDADVQFVDYRGSRDKRETRANYFAAALLMPSGGVRSVAEKLGPTPGTDAASAGWFEQLVCDVATTFHSSVESAIYRCNTLGFYDDAETKRLTSRSAMEMLRRTGHGEYEDVHGTGRDDIDPPAQLAEKALYAFSGGLVGIGTLARLWKADDEKALREELASAGWEQTFD